MFLYYFNIPVLKIIFKKIKKYYFNIFLNKKNQNLVNSKFTGRL